MSEQFTNNAITTLNGAIDSDDTTIVVTSATGFPTTGVFRIIIQAEGANTDEICTVTAVSGTSFTVVRASEATGGSQTASSHGNGAQVAHVLTAGGLRAFAMPTGFIGCSIYHNTTTATSPLPFNSELWDTDGFHSTVTNNSRVTIPAGLGGKYLVTFGGQDAGGVDSARLLKNGVIVGYNSGDNDGVGHFAKVVDCNAGDYLEVEITGSTWGHASIYAAQIQLEAVKLDAGKVGSGVGARVFASANQTCNDSVILFDSEEYDTDGFHSTSSNTSRFTIPTGLGGKYVFIANAQDSSGAVNLVLRKNGTNILGTQAGTASTDIGVNTMAILDLVAADYIEVVAYTGASNHTIRGHATSENAASFQMMRLDSTPSGLETYYVGKNAVGATVTASTTRRVIMKRIVAPTSGILTSVEIYGKNNANGVTPTIQFGVWEDTSGAPSRLIRALSSGQSYLEQASNLREPRWYGEAVNVRVNAGEAYWIGGGVEGTTFDWYRDASVGADRYYAMGYAPPGLADAGVYTVTTTTDDYSIRGVILAAVGASAAASVGGLKSAKSTRTSGDITLNSTSWENVDTGMDLTVAATAGDVLSVCGSFYFASQAVSVGLDAATIVSSSPVNYISGSAGGGSAFGVSGWATRIGNIDNTGTCVLYTVQPGDISGGNITLRLRYRTHVGSNKTLHANSNEPLHWNVTNLRQ